MTAPEFWSRDEKHGRRLLRRRLFAGGRTAWAFFDLGLHEWRQLQTPAAISLLETERSTQSPRLAPVHATVLDWEGARC